MVVITDFINIPSLEFYPQEGKTFYYVFVGVDPGLGIGGDFTGIQGIDAKSCEQVFEWRSNVLAPKAVLEDILAQIIKHPNIKILEVIIESNAIGHEFISRYQELPEKPQLEIKDLPPLYYETKDGKLMYGLENTGVLKPLMIGQLKDMIRLQPEIIKSHRLLNELLGYQILKGGKMGAPKGRATSDDLIMALALAIKGRTNYLLTRPDPEILSQLNIESTGAAQFPDYALPEKLGTKKQHDIILDQKEVRMSIEKWEKFNKKLGL